MNPFEKILERLEERTDFLSDCTKYGNKDAKQQEKSYSTMMLYEVADLVDDLKEIVKEVAEETETEVNKKMKIEITGKMDEKLTEDEYLELIDLLGFKFGIDNIKITEEEV